MYVDGYRISEIGCKLTEEKVETPKEDLQKVCEYVFLHEKEFTDEYLSGSKKETEKFQSKTRSELKRLSERQEEICRIIRKLYEDNVNGRITDERFDFLAKSYEDEGNDLKIKRGCKKIKSILVFAANAVYFKKQGYIAIFLAFPFGVCSPAETGEMAGEA